MVGDRPYTPLRWTPARRAAANALWRILKNQCRGRRGARPKRRLRAELGRAGHVLTPREMDWLVCQVRNDIRFPIATCGRGVFWARSIQELRTAQHYCTSRFDDLRAADRAYEQKIVRWAFRRQVRPASELEERRPVENRLFD